MISEFKDVVSVHLFGDSFFIAVILEESAEEKEVSVPLFGDSFFILSL